MYALGGSNARGIRGPERGPGELDDRLGGRTREDVVDEVGDDVELATPHQVEG